MVHFSLVCLGKYPKPMKSDHKWKSQSGGPFSILQACFGGHLGVVFCKFCNQKGFSEAFFSVFPAFTNRQNPFPVQMSGKCTGKGFSKKICLKFLKFCTMFQNRCDFFWNFVPYFESLWNFWNFIPCFEILWNFCNSIPCFEILWNFWNFIAFFENVVKFLKFCALFWNFVPSFEIL